MAPDMASPSHELTLDFNPSSAYQKPHGDQHAALQQNHKIHEFLARLEEERRKIDAFKRELPLCMQLLNNAIEIYKQQLEAFHRTGDVHTQRPVLEEFIPLKQVEEGDGGWADPKAAVAPPSEKANWMVSAQLWSPALEEAKPLVALAPPREAENGGFDVSGCGSPKLALDSKQRNGGAFLPFSKEKNKAGGCGGVRAANPRALPELALAPAAEKPVEEKKCAELEVHGSRENSCSNGKGASTTEATGAAVLPTHRKARRCWSPDLHRRFVNALQILGGSQVATPKQIRELMKVDGLTNDEVKSHLQKYRLHTRRPPPSPAAPAAATPQLVVLGGIWVPPEFATPPGGASAIYGAAQAAAASAHYCAAAAAAAAAPVPPEFYTLQQQAMASQHHLQRAPVGGYKLRASPESEARSDGGDRSESVEEGEEEKEEVEDEEEEGEDPMEKETGRAESGGVAIKF